MSGLLESPDHWLSLADEQDRRVEDGIALCVPAAKHRAETYRRVARAIDIEIETGVAVCSCCFKPFGAGMRI